MIAIMAAPATFFQSIVNMIYIQAMNLNSLDLNLLVALDALLLEANVSRAAMRIGLSQPAASHAMPAGSLTNPSPDPTLPHCVRYPPEVSSFWIRWFAVSTT